MRSFPGALVALLALTFLLASPASADPDVTPARIDGADRIDTAAEVAELTYDPDTTDAAVLAAAGAFPDAVTGIGVASSAAAPILLTRRDELPARTRQALDTLGVEVVYLVGGEGAISPQVEAELGRDVEVHRVAGEDRYGTAAEVARFLAGTGGIGSVEGERTVLLATGQAFPDALAGGPLAYARRLPVLLTLPEELPGETASVLDELSVQRVVVVGGRSSVSEAVAEDLRARGLSVERLSGADRTRTAVAVADAAVERFGFSSSRVLLARGNDFPDSLAAGPRGGALQAPILLAARPDELGGATAEWLVQACPDVDVVQAVGGTAAISEPTLRAAVDAARSCGQAQRQITYRTGTRGSVEGDPQRFREIAAATLEDGRGWSLEGDLDFTEVAEGGDFRLWLASPSEVDAASSGCSAYYSCRVGDDVYINDERWRQGTRTYADRSLREYRAYVINHEVGHWLGLGHRSCPGEGEAAPVMQQQSISLDGCRSNVWPLPSERQAVRERWVE